VTYKRIVVALLLLAVGVFVGMMAISMLQARQQFVDSENLFRTYPSMVTPEGEWIEQEPSWMEERAQDALGLQELMRVREAHSSFRESQLDTPIDYMMTNKQSLAREVARFRLMGIIRDPDADPALKVDAATLLGDLYSEDAITYVLAKDGEKVREAYEQAVESYTLAITTDPTETLNTEAKEHLETLIRMFMAETEQKDGNQPGSGPRPGASEPGSGY